MSGPLCQDTAERILAAITAGAVAANNALNPVLQSTCPSGMIYNPATATCQTGVTGTVSASGNGTLILLAIAAALLFFGKGNR